MALIRVENAEIVRQVGSRGAFAIQEYVTLPNGQSFPKTYTVWYEGNTNEYKTGAIVTVTGTLSAKVRPYTTSNGQEKHAVDLAINDVEVTVEHDVKTGEEVPF